MNDADLLIHGDKFWISPYFFSAFVALEEKAVPYTVRTFSLYEGEHLGTRFVHDSVTGRVPALRHGDFWLAESSAIVEYLDETFPAPAHVALMPADRRNRARARQVMAWVRSDLGALREQRPSTTIFYAPAKTSLDAAGQQAAAKLVRVAEALVPAEGGPLFGAWCAADADLAFMLHRLLCSDDPVPARLERWAREQWKRPSVRAFVERERPPYIGP